ncbi:RDD family protein [Pengzhenrongella frigida]|uniref:RDD family protein n=1 Tax=Pengzhenrongella frigida TaxID=1259133 RepID=A0A4Q5MXD7_9MICO|nr:RDD family protein [Cellulomonas sp. HLT2-17]RYV50276.1 RDD family protein [Cellulomonas sp. HLT2-17]
MAARDDIGSWLDGTGSGDGTSGAGRRLGLPSTGPGSLASLVRRVAAIGVDWALCLLISAAFFDGDPIATLAVFAVENVLLVGTIGHTLGHRLLGIHVRRAPSGGGADGGRSGGGPAASLSGPGAVGIPRAALRTVLVCLVIPAVVWDGDGRGLHDRAAGTVIVRL